MEDVNIGVTNAVTRAAGILQAAQGRRLIRLALATGLLWGFVPVGASRSIATQEVSVSIIAESVATLGISLPGGGFTARPRLIVRHDRRFVVSERPVGAHWLISSDGRSAGRLALDGIARVDALFSAENGGICVYDAMAGTVAVLSRDLRPWYRVSLNVTLGPVSEGVATAGGGFVFAASSNNPDLIGFPIHSFSAAGMHLASFGSSTEEYRPDQREEYRRLIGGFSDSAVVLAGPTRRTVELWSLSGKLVRRLTLPTAPRGEGSSVDGEVGSPREGISTVQMDAEGHVWIVSRVADRRWRQAVADHQASSGAREEADQFWDSVVEVLDLRSGRMVASRRFDHAFLRFVDAGYVHSDEQSASGRFRSRIWHLTLSSNRR